jgi:hypothetical protein
MPIHMRAVHRETPGVQTAPGNGAASQAVPVPGSRRVGLAAPGTAAQLCLTAGMLAGLWAAISPWFLTLQQAGGNATASNLIVGLVVVALAVSAAAGQATITLQAASALAGVWLIISPFILAAKFPITAAMYWSNVWTGAMVLLLALGVLGLARPRPAH